MGLGDAGPGVASRPSYRRIIFFRSTDQSKLREIRASTYFVGVSSLFVLVFTFGLGVRVSLRQV